MTAPHRAREDRERIRRAHVHDDHAQAADRHYEHERKVKAKEERQKPWTEGGQYGDTTDGDRRFAEALFEQSRQWHVVDLALGVVCPACEAPAGESCIGSCRAACGARVRAILPINPVVGAKVPSDHKPERT